MLNENEKAKIQQWIMFTYLRTNESLMSLYVRACLSKTSLDSVSSVTPPAKQEQTSFYNRLSYAYNSIIEINYSLIYLLLIQDVGV